MWSEVGNIRLIPQQNKTTTKIVLFRFTKLCRAMLSGAHFADMYNINRSEDMVLLRWEIFND